MAQMAVPKISPEEIAKLQAQAGRGENEASAEDSSEDSAEAQNQPVTKKIQTAGKLLQEIAQVVNQSPAATGKDREQMSLILNNYIDLVEKMLSQPSGKDAPEAEAPAAPVPAEGGRQGQPQSPAQRM